MFKGLSGKYIHNSLLIIITKELLLTGDIIINDFNNPFEMTFPSHRLSYEGITQTVVLVREVKGQDLNIKKYLVGYYVCPDGKLEF